MELSVMNGYEQVVAMKPSEIASVLALVAAVMDREVHEVRFGLYGAEDDDPSYADRVEVVWRAGEAETTYDSPASAEMALDVRRAQAGTWRAS